ncbi:MAG: 7-cyano-7-deazaguanine synthase QueC [bacterium]
MTDNKIAAEARQRDSVIIYSGGLDSTTLLYEERERIALAVSFDYGSNHASREIACARYHCELLGIEHLVIELGFMSRYFQSSLFSGADAIPTGSYDEGNMKSTVVPFRNGIMLSIACGMAESRGLKRVLMANHGGDHAIYPDCRPEFVNAMNGAMQAGTYEGVLLAAPYTHLTKADLVRRGTKLGVDYSRTYSCYRGGEYHCGTCGTCTERREAFREAGIPDPTEYINVSISDS